MFEMVPWALVACLPLALTGLRRLTFRLMVFYQLLKLLFCPGQSLSGFLGHADLTPAFNKDRLLAFRGWAFPSRGGTADLGGNGVHLKAGPRTPFGRSFLTFRSVTPGPTGNHGLLFVACAGFCVVCFGCACVACFVEELLQLPVAAAIAFLVWSLGPFPCLQQGLIPHFLRWGLLSPRGYIYLGGNRVHLKAGSRAWLSRLTVLGLDV